MKTLAFDLKGVEKSYGVGDREVPILKDIHLQIPQGQYAAIIGPSGSGKSTLMNLLGCLDVPTAGTVSVMGHDTSVLSDDLTSSLRCRTLGFVFQAFHLLPAYDAVSNVSLAMAYSGRPDRRVRAVQLLTKLGLGHRLHHRPNALSGGEKQRVALARAVANDPPILLADEPTGSLDQINGHAVLDLLDALHREGRTVLLITHDIHVAERAERLIEIVDGRIQSDRMMKRRS